VERVAGDVDGGQFGIADFELGVFVVVEAGVDLEAGAGAGRGDRVDDYLVGGQRSAAPVLGDEAEQPVLDFVPLRCAGREVADADGQAGLVGQALQLGLKRPGFVGGCLSWLTDSPTLGWGF